MVYNITGIIILLGYDNILPTANIYQIPETNNKKIKINKNKKLCKNLKSIKNQ
jgi:hypothetical protein